MELCIHLSFNVVDTTPCSNEKETEEEDESLEIERQLRGCRNKLRLSRNTVGRLLRFCCRAAAAG